MANGIEFTGERVTYDDEDYKATVEFVMYEDKRSAVIHLDIFNNTPRVHRVVTGDFIDLLALLPSLDVERLLTFAPVDAEASIKFQERWGFEPYKVHTYDGVEYLVSESEVYDNG